MLSRKPEVFASSTGENNHVLNKQISQQKARSLMELGSVLWEKVYFRKNCKRRNDKNLFLDKVFKICFKMFQFLNEPY